MTDIVTARQFNLLPAALVERPVEVAHARKRPCGVGMAHEQYSQEIGRRLCHRPNLRVFAAASIHPKINVRCNMEQTGVRGAILCFFQANSACFQGLDACLTEL
ncbi:hypothetical protein [Hoeflea sp.]|uniref:hypothetical protein n=1 Tax=Hoeflea sp. TaxID=1940281 RepID=UPI003B519135